MRKIVNLQTKFPKESFMFCSSSVNSLTDGEPKLSKSLPLFCQKSKKISFGELDNSKPHLTPPVDTTHPIPSHFYSTTNSMGFVKRPC